MKMRKMRKEIKMNEIQGLTIEYDGELAIFVKNILLKCGANLHPELILGSSVGTIWEDNLDVAEVKRNPTRANWAVFLHKYGWSTCGCDNLVHIPNPPWEEAYAMAKTFTGKIVSYDYPINKESFCETSFLCFPKAMNNILKAGYLNAFIEWESLNCLSLEATLDYPDHYDDYDSNMKVFYWTGILDRNGFLKGKLQLNKSETETYSS